MQKSWAATGSSTFVEGDAAWSIAISNLRNEHARLRYALLEVKLESTLRQFASEVGRNPPRLRRWPQGRDRTEIPSLASLRSNVAALRFELVLCQFAWRERKAGFDPNQPRVPAGQAEGGQWTDAGAGTSGDAPPIPEQEPETRHDLYEFAKQAAWWAAKALARETANPVVGSFLNLIDLAYWGYKAAPYVRAYLDEPKSLDELQDAVSNPARGYDIHHIVEKQAAKDANYPSQMIDGPDNLVRIPTLKHWQITGWYMRANSKYNGFSPRHYLSDKDWAERTRVGQEALIEFGVLEP